MMKRLLVLFAALLAAPSLLAQTPTIDVLEQYARKALPQCPGETFHVDPITTQEGPAGFEIFRVVQTSSDEYCGSQKYLAVSPRTGQTLLGSVIKLPQDARPVYVRLAEFATGVLKAPISARIAPLALPDNVKAVALVRTTPFGQFAYNAYIDASERFLLVGLRGNMKENPQKTLLDALDVSSGMHRGSSKGKNEIVELSDFECPTCGRAHKELEPVVSKHLQNVNYVRIDLPLFEHHEWAFQAAMGARALQQVAPSRYWEYVNLIFANQDEMKPDMIDAFVKNFCTDRDISWDAVNKIYSSPTERQRLLDQVSRAFAVGIASTPTYIINGQTMGYGPEGEFTINAVRKAVGLPPVKIAKPEPKKTDTKKK